MKSGEVNDTSSFSPSEDIKKDSLKEHHYSIRDWIGAYQGRLPCADCVGIETELILKDDLTYILNEKYLGTKFGDELFTSTGKWIPIENWKRIELKLNNTDKSRYFRLLNDSTIQQLDRRQRIIDSEYYKLRKKK